MTAAVIDIAIGVICLVLGVQNQSAGQPLLYIIWFWGIAALFFYFAYKNYSKTKQRKNKWSSANNKNAVRSDWEAHIANHIRYKFPSLTVITNDRSIIRAKGSLFRKLEIDIWMPSIRLGIEANGERYHDHATYSRDVRNGTCYSKEMYKEQYCKRKGITLIHVWDSEDFGSICYKVDSAIRQRL